MRHPIPPRAFNMATLTAARFLLGKFLVRRLRGRALAAMITEVEAYDGPRDRASHAHRGKTARNAPMFGPAGHWYLYFTYGMHWMLNVVTGKKGYPAAVLIRGVEGVIGPGRVTRCYHIGRIAARKMNGKPAAPKTGLWIEDRGVRVSSQAIYRAPRIGVGYAGPHWANKQYRFSLQNLTKK